MKERPILFSSPMVRAILEGRKTMTRRVVKLDEFGPSDTPGYDFTFRKDGLLHDVRLADMLNPPRRNFPGTCPYGTIGDRLWVKEAWCREVDLITSLPLDGAALYAATEDRHVIMDDGDGCAVINKDGTERSAWRSPIFMPRWASRIDLEITDIRVERVQDISDADAFAEGIQVAVDEGQRDDGSARGAFRTLWDSINAKRHPWASNPWVWVIEFRRAE